MESRATQRGRRLARTRAIQDRCCAGGIWLLLLIGCFAGALLPGRMFVFRDAAHFYYPLFYWIQQQWEQGKLPLWNSWENSGTAVLAETSSSVFYPGKLLFFLGLPFPASYKLYLLLHLVLAGWSAYRLARSWRLPSAAALLASISYAFGGSVLIQYSNAVFLVSAAWLPLSLLCADRLLATRRWCWAVGFAVTLALMTLGGDPQMVYHVLLVLALLTWVRYRTHRRRRGPLLGSRSPLAGGSSHGVVMRWWPRMLRHRTALVLAAGLLAGLLSAVQIFPAIEWSRLSERASWDKPRNVYEAAWLLVRGSAVLDKSQRAEASWRRVGQGLLGKPEPRTHHAHIYQFSVGPWRLVEFFWPNVYGRMYPEHRRWIEALPAEGRVWTPSLYAGLLPMLLALVAFGIRRAPRRVAWLRWVLLGALLASFGRFGVSWLVAEVGFHLRGGRSIGLATGDAVGGLYWWLVLLLPGYDYYRYPAKWLVVVNLALSLLAAFGWREVFERQRTGRLSKLAIPLVVITAGIFVLFLTFQPTWQTWLEKTPPDRLFGPLQISAAAADVRRAFLHALVLGGVTLWACARPNRLRTTVLLLFTAVDLVLANRWMVATAPQSLWEQRSVVAEQIARDAQRRDLPGPWRVYRAPTRWLPPAWSKRSSPDRQAEGLAWDVQTLMPKYHLLSEQIAIVGASGTLESADFDAWIEAARGPKLAAGNTPLERHAVNLLGVQYLVLPEHERLPNGERVLPRDGQGMPRDASLWYNPDALPRAWIVHEFEQLAPLRFRSPQQLRQRTQQVLRSGNELRDFSREAVLEAAQVEWPRFAANARQPIADRCQLVSHRPTRVQLQVQLRERGVVVLNELYAPGWNAYVRAEGTDRWQPVPIYRTNRILRGVLLPEGTYDVRYEYQPRWFVAGATISALGWLLLLAAVTHRAVRRK